MTLEALTAAQRKALRQADTEGPLTDFGRMWKKSPAGFYLPQTIEPLIAAGFLRTGPRVGAGRYGSVEITEAGRERLARRKAGG